MDDHTPRLKPKTIEFANKLLADPKISATQAYIDTHKTENRPAAAVQASKTLSKPNVIIYMNKHVRLAKQTIVQIANDPSIKPDTRLKASQDILDRNLGKAKQVTEVNATNLNLNIEASEALGDAFTRFMQSNTIQE